jgi:hypothetical protein
LIGGRWLADGAWSMAGGVLVMLWGAGGVWLAKKLSRSLAPSESRESLVAVRLDGMASKK